MIDVLEFIRVVNRDFIYKKDTCSLMFGIATENPHKLSMSCLVAVLGQLNLGGLEKNESRGRPHNRKRVRVSITSDSATDLTLRCDSKIDLYTL